MEKHSDAIDRLRRVLDQVEPDSWRARDVHRRIEVVFAARNDLAGQVAFYTERCRLRPDDLTSGLQLASVLFRSGKVDDAINRYRKLISVAPSRRDLRAALIESLERAGRIADALAECRSLADKVPDDPDVRKRLGQLILKAAPREEREEAERQAVLVWSHLAASRPDDPALALQVAELCRRAAPAPGFHGTAPPATASPLLKAAESYYREALRRSQGAPGACEALGEFLHAQGRAKEAVTAWSAIAAPPADNPASWHRLAEVLDHFGYLDNARAASAKAVAGAPDKFDYHDLDRRLAQKAKDYDSANRAVDHLERLADRPKLTETALRARVDVFEAAGWLDREIRRLEAAAAKAPLSTHDAWLLGLLLFRNARFAKAAAVLESALKSAPDQLLVMKAAADAHEQAGNRQGALRIYRRLAEREPGQALAHLGKIAALELEVGSASAAKEAAETLVRRRPADLDGYRLRSEIAFQLGETREGLDWLNRAMRVADRDVPIRLDLAAALAKYGSADLAAEHYWRCFELADQFEDKRTIVASLAELATARGTQDRFLERLRRLRGTQEDSKTLTLCLVEALRQLGDLGGARIELDKLAAASPDEVGVLKMRANLAAEQRDWPAAIGYQERVVALAPQADQIEHLANYHRAKGDVKAAEETLLRLVELGDSDAFAAAVAHAVDQFAFPEAKRLAMAGLRERPNDWRLQLLAGIAQLATSETRAAEASFEAVLSSPEAAAPLPPPAKSPPRRASSSSARRARASSLLTTARTAMRKNAVNRMAQVNSRPENPLEDVPAGKLADLDDIRDALAQWPRLHALALSSPQSSLSSQARIQIGAGGMPPQVNQQLISGLIQARQRLQQAQQAQQTQQAARLTNQINLIQARLAALQNPQAASVASVQRGAAGSAVGRFMIKDQRSARLESVMGLAAAARQAEHEEEWLQGLRHSARSDSRRRRTLVMAALALNQSALGGEVIAELIRARPDDPFPHIARLFLPSEPVSGSFSTAPDVSRASPNGRESTETCASLRWLIDRRSDLRTELTYGLASELISRTGDLDGATRAISTVVATADLEALARLAGLASRTGDLSLQKTILERAAELAAREAGSPSTAPALGAILEANLLYSDDEAYIQKVLGLLDRCLDQGERGDPFALALSSPAPALPNVNMNINMNMNMNMNAKSFALYEFPPASPCLDASRLDALRLVYTQLEAVDRVPLLVDHLTRRAGESTGRTRLGCRLAASVVLWWRLDRRAALQSLERLALEAPDDPGLALVLAQGHLLDGDIVRALALLDRAETESTPLAREFDRLRAVISKRLRTGTPDQLVDSVLLLLKSRSEEPDLDFLFGGATRAAGRAALSNRMVVANPQPPAAMGGSMGGMGGMMGGIRRANPMASARVASPAGAPPTANLDDLLKHAQSRGVLDALERAAVAQWEKHRGSSRLGALVALARFTRGDIPAAAEAASRWSTLLAARPDLAGDVEALWIVGRCLDHRETASLGRKLARQVLPAVRARGLRPETIDLMIRSIKSAVNEGQKDEALRELERLQETLNPVRAGAPPL